MGQHILVGKPEGKRAVGRPRQKLEDNFRLDVREIRRGSVGCMHLAQDRDHWWDLVNRVMNLQVP
jgi:hypothetical protein